MGNENKRDTPETSRKMTREGEPRQASEALRQGTESAWGPSTTQGQEDHILEINPLSVVSFAIIFSHSEGCLFTLFIVSFGMQKL